MSQKVIEIFDVLTKKERDFSCKKSSSGHPQAFRSCS